MHPQSCTASCLAALTLHAASSWPTELTRGEASQFPSRTEICTASCLATVRPRVDNRRPQQSSWKGDHIPSVHKVKTQAVLDLCRRLRHHICTASCLANLRARAADNANKESMYCIVFSIMVSGFMLCDLFRPYVMQMNGLWTSFKYVCAEARPTRYMRATAARSFQPSFKGSGLQSARIDARWASVRCRLRHGII